MKNLDLFQKGVIKFGIILLLGGLCMMGTISRSVAGEVDSTRVTKWKIFGRVIDEQGEQLSGLQSWNKEQQWMRDRYFG